MQARSTGSPKRNCSCWRIEAGGMILAELAVEEENQYVMNRENRPDRNR